MKLKLGPNFSKFIHRFKIGIFDPANKLRKSSVIRRLYFGGNLRKLLSGNVDDT